MATCIKVSGVQRLTDARYLNALEADTYLGFSLDALDLSAVSAAQAKEIIQWLYDPAVVAEFGMHQAADEISYLADQAGAKAIQVPAGHPLAVAQPEQITFILHKVTDPDLLPELVNNEKVFNIIDLSAGNLELRLIRIHPRSGEWRSLFRQEQVLLRVTAADYTIENVHDWQPYGWDIPAPRSDSETDLSDAYGEFLEAVTTNSGA